MKFICGNNEVYMWGMGQLSKANGIKLSKTACIPNWNQL